MEKWLDTLQTSPEHIVEVNVVKGLTLDGPILLQLARPFTSSEWDAAKKLAKAFEALGIVRNPDQARGIRTYSSTQILTKAATEMTKIAVYKHWACGDGYD